MILVTGASGFLGQHLVRYLSGKGEAVRATYHQHPPSKALQQLPDINWVPCDILDISALENVMEGVTEVYHCAAIVSFDPRKRDMMMHLNIEGTTNIVNQCIEQGIKKLVHVSSIASLGRKSDSNKEITETDEWEESKYNSAYAKSKYYSELEVWRGIAEGLNAVIINPGIILGTGNWDEGSANIMRIVNQEFPFYTKGVNAWVSAADVVKAMYLLMKSDVTGERFILSEGNYGYRDIFNTMAKALNKKPPHIKVSSTVTQLMAQLYMLKSVLSGSAMTITRETARNANGVYHYNNEKLMRYIPEFRYEPVNEAINGMARAFKAEMGS